MTFKDSLLLIRVFSQEKDRTIVKMSRSMLKGKGLSITFWAETVDIVVYILNRSLTKAVFNTSPYET